MAKSNDDTGGDFLTGYELVSTFISLLDLTNIFSSFKPVSVFIRLLDPTNIFPYYIVE